MTVDDTLELFEGDMFESDTCSLGDAESTSISGGGAPGSFDEDAARDEDDTELAAETESACADQLPRVPTTTNGPKMASSVPVQVPMWNRKPVDTAPVEKVDGDGDGKMEARMSTMLQERFIPPHQMSLQDSFLTGASPAASLKRDKIKLRNAVLRSTGFLEGQSPSTQLSALPAVAEVQPIPVGRGVSQLSRNIHESQL